MTLWNKTQVAPQQIRSRFQLILDDMDHAYKRMEHASELFSSLIRDLEKGMKFADQFRVDLTHAIEEAGAKVTSDPGNIEAQIRDIFAGRSESDAR
jgi:hypothetical protein